MTEFPHMHFQVSHHGAIVDPFHAAGSDCTSAHTSLWAPEILPQMPYIDTAILQAGFSNKVPERDRLNAPLIPMEHIPASSAMLTLWVEVMGAKRGDQIDMQITAPDGAVIAENHTHVKSFKAVSFYYMGKQLHAPLMAGTYIGNISITRDRVVLHPPVKK